MHAYSRNAFSLMGFILLAASAVAASLFSTNLKAANCNGHIAASSQEDDAGMGLDRTCTAAVDSANCWTQTNQDTFTSTISQRKITFTAGTKLSHGVVECITIF